MRSRATTPPSSHRPATTRPAEPGGQLLVDECDVEDDFGLNG